MIKKIILIVILMLLAGSVFLFHRTFSYEQGKNIDLSTSALIYDSINLASTTTSTPESIFTQQSQILVSNYCDSNVKFYENSDNKFCSLPPKNHAFRLFEINLSDNRILFYLNGLLQKTYPIAYQAAYGVWFQTPTGYFELGVKKQKFMSSVIPVFMENAVQLYEDFFIHNIPYWKDGSKVDSQFSGGCIRLEDPVALEFYNDSQKGDAVVSYLNFDKAVLKNGFYAPVNISQFWVRQRYNSPLKTVSKWYEDKRENYIQHAGLDLAPYPNATDNYVYAIATGTVEKIIYNGSQDAGLGNGVILNHLVDKKNVYSLYAHLGLIDDSLKVGSLVLGGQKIGKVGNTGYGCNYWRIGKDGCDETGEADTHLHLEIKEAPVLGSPKSDKCVIPSGKITDCVGYTSDNPVLFGYTDPLTFIFDQF
ncbi:MAG TPA: peptidoglycan DD-metalloendopeptidase family protein [Candidatus Paceibacterota bacterium]|nr:peptidoglycan DD-metalloendopeptidase family protein [Candidatus Paceibacterota bacterium]